MKGNDNEVISMHAIEQEAEASFQQEEKKVYQDLENHDHDIVNSEKLDNLKIDPSESNDFVIEMKEEDDKSINKSKFAKLKKSAHSVTKPIAQNSSSYEMVGGKFETQKLEPDIIIDSNNDYLNMISIPDNNTEKYEARKYILTVNEYCPDFIKEQVLCFGVPHMSIKTANTTFSSDTYVVGDKDWENSQEKDEPAIITRAKENFNDYQNMISDSDFADILLRGKCNVLPKYNMSILHLIILQRNKERILRIVNGYRLHEVLPYFIEFLPVGSELYNFLKSLYISNDVQSEEKSKVVTE